MNEINSDTSCGKTNQSIFEFLCLRTNPSKFKNQHSAIVNLRPII